MANGMPDMVVHIPKLTAGCARCGGNAYTCDYQGSSDPGFHRWFCEAQHQPGKSETVELSLQLIPPPSYGGWLYQEWRITYQNGIDDPTCVCRWATMTEQDLRNGGSAPVFGGSCVNLTKGEMPGHVTWAPE